mmetsp:Transcript_52258/g.167534  ORF Transcript_52258/g.167534 Transcript_52258/m.167534 type:complete len:883 (+) Transcript_52258:63-2711(+)
MSRLLAGGAMHALFAGVAGRADPGGAHVHSAHFASALRQIAWTGSSDFSCDLKCRDGCFGIDAMGGHWGDAVGQRMGACVAGCGCGGGANHLLVSTEAGRAHVSLDGGSTWVDFEKQVLGHKQLAEHFRVEQVHVSHADPQYVAVLTNTSTSWMSRDAGKTWQVLRLSTPAQGERQITSLQWHPSTRDWALAESRVAPRSPDQKPSWLVFFTQDAGASWKLLAADVEQCHWVVREGGDRRRIILARYFRQEKASQGSAALEVLVSEDFMASHSVLLGGGAPGGGPRAAVRVHLHQSLVFAVVRGADVEEEGPRSAGLQLWLCREDAVAAQRCHAAAWPANVGPVRSRQLRRLRVLYATEHRALLHLPAEDPALPWGHVFACSPGAPELELVLTDVQGLPGVPGTPAWHAVGGVEGALLANRAVLDRGQGLDSAERRYDAQAEAFEAGLPGGADPGLELGAGDGDEPAAAAASQARLTVRTYASANLGVAWQPLSAPAQGHPGGPGRGCAARDACSLHLARWASSAAAPGIVLGVGNIGMRLAENPEHHSVFVSRNAGLEWRQVLTGPHDVAILSHGDAFIAVPAKTPGMLLYSTDGGASWESVVIEASGSQGLSVQGLFTHPSHTAWRAFLALSSDTDPGVTLAAFDLSGVLRRSCQLVGDPADAASDFETWSPADALEDAHASKRPVCMLGIRTHYVRRKPDRACKTGLLRLAPLDLRKDLPCQCTSADWACDAGFYRATYVAGAPCEPLDGTAQPNVSSLCAATTASHIHVTRGYRKLPGDRCSAGVDLSPRLEPCPGNTGLAAALRNLLGRRPPHWLALAACLVLLGLGARARCAGDEGAGCAARACTAAAKRLREAGRGARKDEGDEEEREFLMGGER